MKTLRISRFPELDEVCRESMNTLCTNLSYCGPDLQTIMITSRYPMEGKSFVSMNLMRSMARLGKRVVLVDTDMRASGIRSNYGIRFPANEHKYGLSDYLVGRCGLEDAIYATDVEDAYLIPAGYAAPNPLRLLESEGMKNALAYLKAAFDVVLVDTPPAGMIVDAVALAKYCDGTVLVVSYQRGKRSDIGNVVRDLQKTGCKVLGAVLNNVNFKSLANRQYYYKSDRYSSYASKKYAYRYRASDGKRNVRDE